MLKNKIISWGQFADRTPEILITETIFYYNLRSELYPKNPILGPFWTHVNTICVIQKSSTLSKFIIISA